MFHQKQKMRWCWHENHVGKTSTCNKEVERLVKTCHRDAQEPQSQPQIAARRWQMAAVNVSNCEYEAGCRWERAAQLGLLEVKTGMKTEATVDESENTYWPRFAHKRRRSGSSKSNCVCWTPASCSITNTSGDQAAVDLVPKCCLSWFDVVPSLHESQVSCFVLQSSRR